MIVDMLGALVGVGAPWFDARLNPDRVPAVVT
jgi:hypothetical protein